MAKQYIKKLNLPVGNTATDLYIKDIEAVSSINGYTVDPQTGKLIDNSTKQEIQFANDPITTEEIDELFSTAGGNQ